MESLPDEVLVLVLEYLPLDAGLIFACRAVCSRWRRCIPRCQRFLPPDDSDESDADDFDADQAVQPLRRPQLGVPALLEAFRMCNQLQDAYLDTIFRAYDREDTCEGCYSLIGVQHYHAVRASLLHLQHLRVVCLPEEILVNARLISALGPSVEELTIPKATATAVLAIAACRARSRLQKLHIKMPDGNIIEEWQPNMEDAEDGEVKVATEGECARAVLPCVLAACSALKELRLSCWAGDIFAEADSSGGGGAGGDAQQQQQQQHRERQRAHGLALHLCEKLKARWTNEPLPPLPLDAVLCGPPPLQALRCLTLDRCGGISDAFFSRLAAAAPALQVLRMYGCKGESTAAAWCAVRRMPQLQVLQVWPRSDLSETVASCALDDGLRLVALELIYCMREEQAEELLAVAVQGPGLLVVAPRWSPSERAQPFRRCALSSGDVHNPEALLPLLHLLQLLGPMYEYTCMELLGCAVDGGLLAAGLGAKWQLLRRLELHACAVRFDSLQLLLDRSPKLKELLLVHGDGKTMLKAGPADGGMGAASRAAGLPACTPLGAPCLRLDMSQLALLDLRGAACLTDLDITRDASSAAAEAAAAEAAAAAGTLTAAPPHAGAVLRVPTCSSNKLNELRHLAVDGNVSRSSGSLLGVSFSSEEGDDGVFLQLRHLQLKRLKLEVPSALYVTSKNAQLLESATIVQVEGLISLSGCQHLRSVHHPYFCGEGTGQWRRVAVPGQSRRLDVWSRFDAGMATDNQGDDRVAVSRRLKIRQQEGQEVLPLAEAGPGQSGCQQQLAFKFSTCKHAVDDEHKVVVLHVSDCPLLNWCTRNGLFASDPPVPHQPLHLSVPDLAGELTVSMPMLAGPCSSGAPLLWAPHVGEVSLALQFGTRLGRFAFSQCFPSAIRACIDVQACANVQGSVNVVDLDFSNCHLLTTIIVKGQCGVLSLDCSRCASLQKVCTQDMQAFSIEVLSEGCLPSLVID